MKVLSYARTERQRQVALRSENDRYPKSGSKPGLIGARLYDVILPDWTENIYEPIRASSMDYFLRRKISWHRMRGHVLSSQICCLNFLMPFATRPKALEALLAPIFPGKAITALPIEGEGTPECPAYVAFEWTGRGNYLGEAPVGVTLPRGANSTSVDAAVLLEVDGRRELVLIEWKYTESYGAPLNDKVRQRDDGALAFSNEVRMARYADKLFAQNGPLKASEHFGLADLFWKPFYQFARQQMLAFQLENHHEEGADRVSILHLAPRGNLAFQRITSPALARCDLTACARWKSLLSQPDRFDSWHIEDVLARFPAAEFGLSDWALYILVDMDGRLADVVRLDT